MMTLFGVAVLTAGIWELTQELGDLFQRLPAEALNNEKVISQ